MDVPDNAYYSYFRLPDTKRLSNPFVYTQNDGINFAIGWRYALPMRDLAPANFPFKFTFDRELGNVMSPNESIQYLTEERPYSGAVDNLLVYIPMAIPENYPSVSAPPRARGWALVPRTLFENVFGEGTLGNVQNISNLIQVDSLCVALLDGCRARMERIQFDVPRKAAYDYAFHISGMYSAWGEKVYYPDMLAAPEWVNIQTTEFFPKRAIIPMIHYLNIRGHW